MKSKYIITFAGVPGSGKSPIANYLSQQFLVPVFNTDSIRKEIAEDNLGFDREKFKRLRDERLHKLLKKEYPFILDGSVDREWEHYKEMFDVKFDVFIISMDLSKNLLEKLHNSKIYKDTVTVDPSKWIGEHKRFLEKFGNLVNLSITDEFFKNRLKLSEEKVRQWLAS